MSDSLFCGAVNYIGIGKYFGCTKNEEKNGELLLSDDPILNKALRDPEIQKMLRQYNVRPDKIRRVPYSSLSKVDASNDILGIHFDIRSSTEEIIEGLKVQIPNYYNIEALYNCHQDLGEYKLNEALKDPNVQDLIKQYKISPNDLLVAHFPNSSDVHSNVLSIYVESTLSIKDMTEGLKREIPKFARQREDFKANK